MTAVGQSGAVWPVHLPAQEKDQTGQGLARVTNAQATVMAEMWIRWQGLRAGVKPLQATQGQVVRARLKAEQAPQCYQVQALLKAALAR